MICEFGCANKNSTGHLVSQIPNLVEGVDVEIIDVSSAPWLFRWLYAELEKCSGVGPLRKLVALMGLLVAFLFRRGTYDHVIVVSNPFLTFLVPSIFWRIKRAKLHYLVFDLFPETLRAAGKTTPTWALRSISAFRNRNLRRANSIFVIGRDMKQRLIEQGVGTTLIYTPLWIGATEKAESGISTVKESTPLHDKFKLSYFGNIGHVQDFGEVYRLIDSNSGFSLDVYGAGSKLKSIAAESQGRARFLGSVPFRERSSVFKSCGIGLVPQACTLVGLAVPSKAFYYWSHGLPIIFLGNPASELGQIISESPALGVVVAPGSDIGEFAAELQAIAENVSRGKIISICAKLRNQAKIAFESVLARNQ